jgi:hypothetical protein
MAFSVGKSLLVVSVTFACGVVVGNWNARASHGVRASPREYQVVVPHPDPKVAEQSLPLRAPVRAEPEPSPLAATATENQSRRATRATDPARYHGKYRRGLLFTVR